MISRSTWYQPVFKPSLKTVTRDAPQLVLSAYVATVRATLATPVAENRFSIVFPVIGLSFVLIIAR